MPAAPDAPVPHGHSAEPAHAAAPSPLAGKEPLSRVKIPRLRWPKAVRLTQTSEFSRVKTEGRAVHGKCMFFGVLSGLDGTHRVGIVTSRRVGGAVVRNRVRRRLREIARAALQQLAQGVWLVVVAKPPAARASFDTIRAEWEQLARRAGILPKVPQPLKESQA